MRNEAEELPISCFYDKSEVRFIDLFGINGSGFFVFQSFSLHGGNLKMVVSIY